MIITPEIAWFAVGTMAWQFTWVLTWYCGLSKDREWLWLIAFMILGPIAWFVVIGLAPLIIGMRKR